jgi:hypothetical protein
MGAGAIAAAYMLVINRIPSVFLRVLVCAVLLAFLVTPAPVPEYPSNFAPAFIVAVFEGVLQSGGSPWAAVRLLLVGLMLAIAAVTLTTLGLRRFRPPPQAGD